MGTLTVIIVTYNSEADIRACLDSLRAEVEGLPHEVFVVDNASRDGTVGVVRDRYPWVKLLANAHNAGFPGANNQAIRQSSGELVLLLNPDTVVQPGSLRKMLAAMETDPGTGLCGPRLPDANGVLAPDIRFPSLLRNVRYLFLGRRLEAAHLSPDRTEALSGAALLARRSVYDRIGLLDERMFWREDVDFCYRARREGLGIRVVEEARITHLVGRSAVSNLEVALEKPISSEIAFFMKHKGRPAALLETAIVGFETLLRLGKWEALSLARGTPEARLRVRAFRSILRRLPAFYREARDRYGNR